MISFSGASYTKIRWIVSDKQSVKKGFLHFIKVFCPFGLEWRRGVLPFGCHSNRYEKRLVQTDIELMKIKKKYVIVFLLLIVYKCLY